MSIIVYERWWWHQYLAVWIRDPLDGDPQRKVPDGLAGGKGRWKVWEINVQTGRRKLYQEGE